MMLGHPTPTKDWFPNVATAMAIHLGEKSLCVLCASVVELAEFKRFHGISS